MVGVVLAQICDVNKNGQLDLEEFEKCCRLNNLGLTSQDIGVLYRHFDRDRSGGVSYNEFLRVVRGRLSPVRKQMVKKIFDVLDKCAARARHARHARTRACARCPPAARPLRLSAPPHRRPAPPPRLAYRLGGERGFLTIQNIEGIYSVSKHPAVMAGKMTKEEALQEFLNSFEGEEGNRDGKVTLDEWVRHYEEVSSSIDSDDYFGTMMSGAWSRLKQKMPNGAEVPAVKFTPRADVDLLEKQLRKSIYEKTPANTNSRRTAELAFKSLDTDGSGGVSVDEFIKALERFGMHVAGMGKGVGGLPRATVEALFNKYDTDGSGNISYKEFTDALFADEEPMQQPGKDAPKSLTGKICYKDNEWLKGSNGIFEGIFGGGGDKSDRLRPPSGPGIGGNFQRRIGQMG